MLQMRRESLDSQRTLETSSPFPPPWNTMAELDHATSDWISRWLSHRGRIVQKNGLFSRFSHHMDRIIRTDRPEHTDDPEISAGRKIKIVRNIHRTNILLGVYRHYIRILTPLIHEIAAKKKRPARLLELASGSGEMAMNLARLAAEQRLPVEITGSDYIEEVVRSARQRAAKRGLKIDFRTINAFDMNVLQPGEYDVFFIIGTMHHFSPGRLATILAQSRKFAGSAFVGIDGYRSLALLLWLPVVHLVTLSADNMHDCWVTARKFYSLFELEHIARIAMPDVPASVFHSFPGLSVLTARF